ncbi:MAG: hypothetical protein JWP91_3757 [Fibrobacteres bacterium]|nr:hypothetical protein [Fibrobacterota bacterium]
MIKPNSIAIACLTASGLAGWAMAQDNLSTGTYPPSSSSPSSTVSAPRTGLYETVTKGNAAADNTVDDFTRRPTLIGTKQYFAGFGGADMQSGAFSFEGRGWNWFGSAVSRAGSAQGGANPAEVRAGIASGTAWGGGLILSFDKSTTDNAGTKTKTVIEGDGFGAFGDFNLGNSDVYGQVALYTGFDALLPPVNNYIKVEPPSPLPTTETNNYLINAMGGWKKDATTEGTHALNVEVGYNYSKNEVDPSTPANENSINELAVMFAHGYILRATPDYSVFLGTNNLLIWRAEKTTAAPTEHSIIGISTSPNLAFQKQFGKGFEGFSGGSVTASYFSYSNEPFGIGAPEEATRLLTADADVAVGLRWVKDNFALEGSLKEAVLLNGPYLIGGNANQGLMAEVGMSLGI